MSDHTTQRRILHVFGRMHRGGAELRTLEVMRAVDRERYPQDFCALSGQPGSLDEEIRALGGEVHPLPVGPAFPWRFRRLLRERRYDVVHSHVHYASGLIVWLAALEGVPVRIVHFRNMHDGKPDDARRRLQRALLRRLIDRYATSIAAVSECTMQTAWRPDWRVDPRCEVTYVGLDLSRFAGDADRAGVRREFGFPHECPLYVHVGRLAPQKNQLRAVAVFARILARQPDARLLLVGHGDPAIEARLRETLADPELQGAAVFAGERSDVPRLLRAADAMIFPTLWEGVGGVMLEACAAGIPVLASDIAPVIEVAAQIPSVRALPLDADDDTWAAEARRLAAAAANPAAREEIRRAFAASSFDLATCVRQFARMWEGRAAERERAPERAWEGGEQNVLLAR